MVDQLLSQADVDALVTSLTKNDPPKPAAPAPVTAAVKQAPAPVVSTPVNPVAKSAINKMPARPPGLAATSNVAPAKMTPGPVNPEISGATINSLNARISELNMQLVNMGTAIKRMEGLENKVIELEAKLRTNQSEQKIQQLKDEVAKIVTNLKGTPGYAGRQRFTCEKCNDHGHVAVQYRCTNCGQERWYGWWPDKNK
jgi:hypothetical protein